MTAFNKNMENPLIEAARKGHIDIVRSLLSKGVDVNVRDKYRQTALCHAAFNGHLGIVKLLLKYRALVDTKDMFGGTPLLWTVCGVHVEIAKILTDHGADVNAKDHRGTSPFLRSASGVFRPAHINICKLFLNLGADVNQTDNNGVTALMNAASEGLTEIVDILIKNGAEVNMKCRYGDTALIRACRAYHHDCPEIVQLLIEHGAEIHIRDINNKFILNIAAEKGHTGIVKALLNAGLEVNTDGGASLRSACEQGKLTAVRQLLEHNANVNLADSAGQTPLMLAVSRRYNEIAFLLLDAGADINAATSKASWGADRTVLMFALGSEDFIIYERDCPPLISLTLIQHLLEKGAEAAYKNQAGITPLKLAQKKQNNKIIRLLKKYGATE